MLATRVPNAPDGDGWLHEVKFDGYRLLGFFARGGVRLLTRNGHDWTHLFGPVARAFADRLKKPAVLDGEVVVLNARGLSDFHALQAALDGSGPKNLVFMAFDLPWHDGFDLSAVPLEERKALLERLLGDDQSGSLRYSAHIIGDGPKAQAAAAKAGLEGIMSKRLGSPYRSGRSLDWLKIKVYNRQEFVIGGYTPPEGSRPEFGSIIIGQYDDQGRLVFRGRVGSGFKDADLRRIKAMLDGRKRASSPFDTEVPRAVAKTATWARPELVAEVKYNTISRDGVVRQGSFVGLRADKPAGQVTPERVAGTPQREPAKRGRKVRGERTRGDRRS